MIELLGGPLVLSKYRFYPTHSHQLLEANPHVSTRTGPASQGALSLLQGHCSNQNTLYAFKCSQYGTEEYSTRVHNPVSKVDGEQGGTERFWTP